MKTFGSRAAAIPPGIRKSLTSPRLDDVVRFSVANRIRHAARHRQRPAGAARRADPLQPRSRHFELETLSRTRGSKRAPPGPQGPRSW
jgi:hypothetical protein